MFNGDHLRAAREKKGWTQEQLAQKLGVSKQAVSQWEAEKTTPSMDNLLLCCKYLEVDIAYLCPIHKKYDSNDNVDHNVNDNIIDDIHDDTIRFEQKENHMAEVTEKNEEKFTTEVIKENKENSATEIEMNDKAIGGTIIIAGILFLTICVTAYRYSDSIELLFIIFAIVGLIAVGVVIACKPTERAIYIRKLRWIILIGIAGLYLLIDFLV